MPPPITAILRGAAVIPGAVKRFSESQWFSANLDRHVRTRSDLFRAFKETGRRCADVAWMAGPGPAKISR
jgi:hypothetical protein